MVTLRTVLTGALLAFLSLAAVVPSAQAHGFSSVVYADATATSAHHVRVELGLEYDLLLVSVADTEGDDAFFEEGDPPWQSGDLAGQASALEGHLDSVTRYVTERFTVSTGGSTGSTGSTGCTPTVVGDPTVSLRDVPYAGLVLDYACPGAGTEHEVTSTLFPDTEGYVSGTRTVVTYDLDLREGSAVLDGGRPTFSTHQSTAERFWEFFTLGAEHLLSGTDHLLFLLALIAGSRRLREVVLAATTFTLAHSVTLLLAALGLVEVPPAVVEPIIALSIAVVAGWHLWRLWRRGSHATDLDTTATGHLALDRAGWARLAVVFGFGLVHGLGFAGALGIEQAWSWTLLWSLLVFNLGIETVQLGLIACIFPLLALLRHRAPLAGLRVTGAIAGLVTVFGVVWFVERVLGG